MLDSHFGEVLVERMVDEVGDYKYVTNGCKQACRHLCSYRKDTYFEGDVDAFEDFVSEQIADLNHYRSGGDRFPVDGRAGEPNYRYLNHRDLLLTEERPNSPVTDEPGSAPAADMEGTQ